MYTNYELLWLFFIYSVIGWCICVAASAVKRKKFVNTGVLNLPLSPSFGAGAVVCMVFLRELEQAPLFLFVSGAVISGVMMVAKGVVLERIFHHKWQDFGGYRFSFGGYFTVPLLGIFGALVLLELYVLNPLLAGVIHLIPVKIGKILLYGLAALFVIDLCSVLAVVWKWRRNLKRFSGLTENMQMVSDSLGNAIARAICHRLEKSYPNIETGKMLAEGSVEKQAEKTCFAQGCGFYKLVWLFLIGAFLGDLVETMFCRLTMGYWMSRSSVVYGPFSIVWGLACALLTAFLYKYKDKSDRYIFMYGTVVGGVYEYICSVFTELVFGTVFWDYSEIPFNIGGRINLLYCFFWGIAAVVWLKGVYPYLSALIEKIPKKSGPVLTWALIVFMCVNMLISAMALGRYSARQTGRNSGTQIEQILDARFPDERMNRIYPKAQIVANE